MTHSVHSRHLLTVILTVGMTALGLSFPARAFAQSPTGAGAAAAEHATFLLLMNADTMVIEHATRTATRLSGQVVIRGQGMRFVYQADVGMDGGIPGLVNAVYLAADTVPRQRLQVRIVGDTAFAGMGEAEQAIPTAAGAIPIVTNLSTAFLEQLVLAALARGGVEERLPVFLLMGGRTMPAAVRLLPGAGGPGMDSATIAMPGLVIRLAVRADGRILGGVVPSQGARIVRLDTRSTLLNDAPDYDAPPGAPYTTEDVQITTPAGIRLAGTLTLPAGAPSSGYPAVVTITGSGAQTRDGVSIGLSGYKPFRQLADTLGRRGIAVLRLDDRGAGASDAGPPTATTADFAADIRAALAFLRAHPRIDSTRLGLVGHSEGAIIAPMVAAEDRALRGVVLLAGPGRPGRAVLRYQQQYAVDSIARLTGASREAALASAQAATDSLALSLPWFHFFIEHDPTVTARQVRSPVLILQAEMDHQVPMAEAMLLAQAIRAGGNESVTVRTFPALNHLFVPHGGPGFDYSRLPSLSVQPEVLGAIAEWLILTLR
jgi:dienelactone hydrolase